MNGYPYNGGYDGSNMEQGVRNGGNNMMMMEQDAIGGGMVGGQSLDEIVNQNAKAIRRQSMPQSYSGQSSSMDPEMKRMSMMEYNGGSPPGPMGNFHYDPNSGMNQSGMATENGAPAQNQYQRSHSRRQSQAELALNTSFANPPQGYNSMMHNSAYQSPANPQSGFDMTMDSPYIDPGMSMQMEYNIENNLGSATAADMPQMNMYGKSQFNQPMMSSPVPRSGSQGTSHSAQGPFQDPGSGGGINTQYSGHTNNSSGTLRQLSRSQSLHMPETSSPVHSGGVTPMSQPTSAHPQNQANMGFQGQPQNPQPGSQQDHGMRNAASGYDGVNGPLPVNAGNYNPNNQGFEWEAQEGGWPSTMVGRPHMQTSYKNAYSSTGFDMLGVLV